MMKKKFFYSLLIVLLVNSLFFSTTLGKEQILSSPTLDILFVVDCSGSMNSTDKNRIALDTIKMFIDTVNSNAVQIGYVAYNDSIISSLTPSSLQTQSERDLLKSKIDTLPRKGYTDISIGLKHTTDMLTSQTNPNTIPLIILLSDGETDLPPSSLRTLTDVQADLQDALLCASASNIPIHTIALGEDYSDTLMLERIAIKSEGQFYSSPSSDNLMGILNAVIAPYSLLTTSPISQLSSDMASEPLNISVPNDSVEELNLIFRSSPSVTVPSIVCEAEAFEVSSSNLYTAIKIKKPAKQTIQIHWNSTSNEPIYFQSIFNYGFDVLLSLPDTISKGTPATFLTSLINPLTNEVIYDEHLYTQLNQRLSSSINQNTSFSSSYTPSGLSTSFVPTASGAENLSIYFDGIGASLGQSTFDFTVVNSAPKIAAGKPLRFPTNGETKTYSLATYVSDVNNDPISYELVVDDFLSDVIHLDNSNLSFSPLDIGNGTFQIKAIDSEGAYSISEPISVRVVPFFQYYSIWGLSIIALLFGLTLLIMFSRKHTTPSTASFCGRINGYLIAANDSHVIDSFTTALYPFEGSSRLSLQQLLEQLHIEYPIDHLNDVYLLPTDDHTLMLYHDSDITILIDHALAKSKTYYALSYDTKLSISSDKSQAYELDLFYVKHTAS